MKIKHSDIDYIGQILDDVLYDRLEKENYHKLSKEIADTFKCFLIEVSEREV